MCSALRNLYRISGLHRMTTTVARIHVTPMPDNARGIGQGCLVFDWPIVDHTTGGGYPLDPEQSSYTAAC